MGAATDVGRVREATRTPTSSTTRWVSSPSPTAWAATAAARSRAPPRSRRCAPRSPTGARCARRSRTPTTPSSPSRSPTTSSAAWARRSPRRRSSTGGTLLVGHVGDSRAYLLHDGELAPGHRRPQPGRGARPRGPAHRRGGRGRTRSARSSRARSASTRRRGRRVPGGARARRPRAALLRRPHRHGRSRDDIAGIAAPRGRPDARGEPRSSTPPTRAGGEDNITVGRRRGHRRRAAARGPRLGRADRGARSSTEARPPTGAGQNAGGAVPAASAGCCCGRSRSSSCSASRSARSAGTRAQELLRRRCDQGRVTVYKGVPGGSPAGTRPSSSAPRSTSPISSGPPTSPR